TRIKRNAANAFDAETIATPEFTIAKPDGMLHVINGDPKFLFEAYSKEFAADVSRNVRLATVTIQMLTDPPDNPAEEITSELNELIGDHPYKIIEARRTEDGAEFRVFRKSADLNGQTVLLEVVAIDGASDDLMNKLENMVDSF